VRLNQYWFTKGTYGMRIQHEKPKLIIKRRYQLEQVTSLIPKVCVKPSEFLSITIRLFFSM